MSPSQTLKNLLLSQEPDFEDLLYFYKATVVRVVDGDTIVVDLDLGCSILSTKEVLRLCDPYDHKRVIDAPEMSTAAGKEFKWAVQALLPPMTKVFVRTYKDKTGYYKRLLADVIYFDLADKKYKRLSETVEMLIENLQEEFGEEQ